MKLYGFYTAFMQLFFFVNLCNQRYSYAISQLLEVFEETIRINQNDKKCITIYLAEDFIVMQECGNQNYKLKLSVV